MNKGFEARAGHQVYCRTFGEGPRRGLMLHCSLAHGGVWRGVAEQLGGGFAFESPDQLSHGKSAFWDRVGDYHDASTALAESFLGDSPIDVVGHSFGATVALRLGLENPHRVRSLVLMEPVFFAAAFADKPELKPAHQGVMQIMRDYLAAGDEHEAARAFIGAWGGGAPWEMLPQEMRDAMASRIHMVVDTEPALYDDHAGLLEGGRLEGLDVPVLLMRGATSPEPIASVNEALARRIPAARSVVVEGAGHMLPISHPQPCAAEMLRFWGV